MERLKVEDSGNVQEKCMVQCVYILFCSHALKGGGEEREQPEIRLA